MTQGLPEGNPAYEGVTIRLRQNGDSILINSTDFWYAEGKFSSKRPSRWNRSKKAQELLESIASSNKASVKRDKQGKIVFISGVLETVKGGFLGAQGAWVNLDVGNAYAESLSPECHQWFEEIFGKPPYTQVPSSESDSCFGLSAYGACFTTEITSKLRVPPFKVKVLGVEFQAFLDPTTSQPVFSQRGASRALKLSERSLRRILVSDTFKALRGGDFPRGKLATTVSSTPISVVTQTDLVLLVQIASEMAYPVAVSMQQASFAVLLQQSVDEALGVHRTRKDYLEAGANLRQRLEYRYSYHAVKNTTLEKGYGVRALCRVNKQVSSLAVPDSDERRLVDPAWRKKCTGSEMVRITVGNAVHQKAVDASQKHTLDNNLVEAAKRTDRIYDLIDAPYKS
jgi:hypothetical protein